jgi:hypothetical protein
MTAAQANSKKLSILQADLSEALQKLDDLTRFVIATAPLVAIAPTDAKTSPVAPVAAIVKPTIVNPEPEEMLQVYPERYRSPPVMMKKRQLFLCRKPNKNAYPDEIYVHFGDGRLGQMSYFSKRNPIEWKTRTNPKLNFIACVWTNGKCMWSIGA